MSEHQRVTVSGLVQFAVLGVLAVFLARCAQAAPQNTFHVCEGGGKRVYATNMKCGPGMRLRGAGSEPGSSQRRQASSMSQAEWCTWITNAIKKQMIFDREHRYDLRTDPAFKGYHSLWVQHGCRD